MRYWLPPCDTFSDLVKSVEAIPGTTAQLHALRSLANHDLDFAAVMRVDRMLRRNKGEGGDREGFLPLRLAVLGSSTTGHLLAGLRVAALGRGMLLELYETAYGQSWQELADNGSGLHAFAPRAVLFAQDAYALFGGVADKGLIGREEAADLVESAVSHIVGQWKLAREAFGAAIIQQLPLNPFPRIIGENEDRIGGTPFALVRAFQRALENMAADEGVALLDLDYWVGRNGFGAWHDAGLWHRAKQEINPVMAPLYGDLVARSLAARFGRSAKCLVLDLDNTLWGGVIGDDGLEGIAIGQGSAAGESFLAFQRYARQLSKRGILLAVCSKNDDAVARRAFVEHPDMLLRLEDISCFVCNWSDKAGNLRHIAKTLNIGLDALVFADDNPFERALVRRELPEVFVPELPDDPSGYAATLADSGYFEAIALTEEDLAKVAHYQANSERQAMLDSATDLGSYLAGLDMELKGGPFDAISIPRATQLINKTNQFNLTTRRYTEAEVRAMAEDPDVVTLQVRLVDRFGDNGIISVVIGKVDRAAALLELDSWLMSCRVLGRDVEKAVLNELVRRAGVAGCTAIRGTFLASGRNAMVEDHYARLGFARIGEGPEATRWEMPVAGFEPFSTHIKTEVAA